MTSFCRAPGCLGPDGLPRLTTSWLCADCDARTAGVVRDAGVLYLAVREQLTPGGNRGGERRPASSRARPPLNVTMLALAHETTALFTQWSAIVAGSSGYPAVPTDAAFVAAIATLLRDHAQIMASDMAPAYAGDLRRWSDRVRHLTGYELPPVRLSAPCPVCDLRGLRWYPSQQKLICAGCRAHGGQILAKELQTLADAGVTM